MPGVRAVEYAIITEHYTDTERYSEYNCGNKHCARCLIWHKFGHSREFMLKVVEQIGAEIMTSRILFMSYKVSDNLTPYTCKSSNFQL